MLLLMALRDSIDDKEYQETIQKRFLEKDRAGEGTEFKIKLKQVDSDWEAYKLLALRHEIPGDQKNPTVYQNYVFFRRAIDPLTDTEKKVYGQLFRFKSLFLNAQKKSLYNPSLRYKKILRERCN